MPSSPATTDTLIQVAVPVPGLGLLSYRVADGSKPSKGARVSVPLGARNVTGVVISHHSEVVPGMKIRDVSAVIDAEAFLPPSVVDLAVWVGEYLRGRPRRSPGDRHAPFRARRAAGRVPDHACGRTRARSGRF